MITILIILGIWFVLGLIAEIIGTIHAKKFNGIKNALIIIGLGLISLFAVCSDIHDGYDYKQYNK